MIITCEIIVEEGAEIKEKKKIGDEVQNYKVTKEVQVTIIQFSTYPLTTITTR